MPVPVAAVVGGIALGQAVAGWMNSEAGRRASAEERERMMEILNAVQEPNFDMSQIDPMQYQVLEKFTPEVSDLVLESNPQLIEQSAHGQIGADSELEAMQSLREIARTGDSPQAQILRSRAREESAIANRANQNAIGQSFQRRGISGSGLELATKMGAAQAQGVASHRASEDSALRAYDTQLQALRDSAMLGGNIQNRELDRVSKNTDRTNQFNMRRTQDLNTWRKNRDGVVNNANMYNIERRQGNDDRNREASYKHRIGERDYRNKMYQQGFDNRFAKASGAVKHGNRVDDIRAQTQDRSKLISGLGKGAMTTVDYGMDDDGGGGTRGGSNAGYYDDSGYATSKPKDNWWDS